MKKRMGSITRRAAGALARGMDYPVDAFLDAPALHFIGADALVVEGCRGLLEYSERRITFDLGTHSASLYGRGLRLEDLSAAQMNVRGDFASLTLDKKGKT